MQAPTRDCPAGEGAARGFEETVERFRVSQTRSETLHSVFQHVDQRGLAATAMDLVGGEVRELRRRRDLDPFADPGPVRVLERDVVASYSERLLTSALPPIGDSESVVRDALDWVAGFRPLQRYLDDPEIGQICVLRRTGTGQRC